MPAVQLRYGQLRTILIAAYALFAAAMLGATSVYLWSDRQSRVTQAYARTSTLARALEEHVSRAFGTVEVHLHNVARRLAEMGALARPSTPQVVAMLRDRAAQAGIVRSIYAYDASGLGHTTSLGADITSLRATDYEHTRRVLESGTDRLVIGRVVGGAITGQPNIPVALGILDKSGHSAGIVGSSILPDYFAEFYKSIGLGEGGSVALVRRDGAVLARYPAVPGAPDNISRSTVFIEQIARQPSGAAEIPAALDKVRRFISFRHIPEYDLIVAVTESSGAVLAPWRRLAATVGFAVVAILFTFLALLIFSLRELKAHADTEEALHKNFELLDRVFETTHFCLVYLDRNFNFVRVNKAYADACGHPPEFFPDRNRFDVYPGEKVEAIFRRVVATGEPFTIYANPFEFPDHPEWGVTYWDWSLHPLRNEDGRVEGLLFALLDVSERKRAEQSLHDSELRLRLATRAANIGLWDYDLKSNGAYFSPEWKSQLGYRDEEIADRMEEWMDRLHPDDRPKVVSLMSTIFESGRSDCQLEFRLRHKDGTYRWIYSRGEIQRDAGGMPARVLGCHIDITELKQTAQLNAQLAAIVECSNDAIISRGPDRAILTWNAAAERLFGYTAAEVIGRNVSVLIPADQEARAAQGRALLEDGLPVSAYDAVRLGKDGRRIDVSIIASPIKDASGKMIGASLVFRDIGERRRAEVERAQLAAIVESSNDAIVIRGPERTILSWNAAAERLFGWSAQEAVGQSIDLIVPPERIGTLQPFIERAARGEPVSPVETTHLRKDGARIATQVTFSPVRDKQGNVIAHSFTARDMSELKRNEEALRSYATRLRELSRRLREVEETERRRISRELHDRVGQDLSTLTLLFGRLASRLSEASLSAVHREIADIQGLLKSTVRNVRDVMAELRPPVLDDYGLSAALRNLVTAFTKRTGISVELSGVDLHARLPLIVETAMFRISQEALNNIAKHAQAKKVEIGLSEASERVVLDIADDGVGFDTSDTPHDREHWGMLSMRERAEAVGIAFRLKSAPGAGTRIMLEVERTAP